GMCTIAGCAAGHADCNLGVADGCEIDTTTDPLHCGNCANACSTNHDTPTCVAGACQLQCNAGFADCDLDVKTGCEITTATSLANCGACGAACAPADATGQCGAGQCKIGSCNPGFSDCNNDPADGCEAHLTVDTANCE